jgi:hypothetical protein
MVSRYVTVGSYAFGSAPSGGSAEHTSLTSTLRGVTVPWFTSGMATINSHIAGSSLRRGSVVVGRTPADLQVMVAFLRDNPDEWFVYSIHTNMPTAHARASNLRHTRTPASLVAHKRHLEFKGYRHAVHGPCVLVRWVA